MLHETGARFLCPTLFFSPCTFLCYRDTGVDFFTCIKHAGCRGSRPRKSRPPFFLRIGTSTRLGFAFLHLYSMNKLIQYIYVFVYPFSLSSRDSILHISQFRNSTERVHQHLRETPRPLCSLYSGIRTRNSGGSRLGFEPREKEKNFPHLPPRTSIYLGDG